MLLIYIFTDDLKNLANGFVQHRVRSKMSSLLLWGKRGSGSVLLIVLQECKPTLSATF